MLFDIVLDRTAPLRLSMAVLALLVFDVGFTAPGKQAGAVTTQDFDREVIEASDRVPVVVEFYADWCTYCRLMQPVLADLAAEYAGRIRFKRVDIESESELAARFDVDGVPTVYVFDAGLPVARLEGVASRTALKGILEGFAADQSLGP